MKFRLSVLLMAISLIVLSACSSPGSKLEPDTFSKNDLGIIKVDDPEFKLSYGMNRDDVEKLLGVPKEDENKIKHQSSYDFGIRIMYRDDTVAGIVLEDSSMGIYQTVRGIGVGSTSDQIKEAYGSKYALDDQSYIFDSKNERFIESIPTSGEDPKDLEQIYAMTPTLTDGDIISRIHLLDFRMATRLD